MDDLDSSQFANTILIVTGIVQPPQCGYRGGYRQVGGVPQHQPKHVP